MNTSSRTTPNAPCYHLASLSPHGEKPHRVPTYPCAITGAPVAAYDFRQSARGSETMFSRPFRTLFHQPGSLWRIVLPTLLFTAFARHCLISLESTPFSPLRQVENFNRIFAYFFLLHRCFSQTAQSYPHKKYIYLCMPDERQKETGRIPK